MNATQFFKLSPAKRPGYIFEFNSQQVNVGGIHHFLAQFKGLELRNETLNAANIYRVEIKLTKCKYIDRSFVP